MGWAEDNERERIRRMFAARPEMGDPEEEPFPRLEHTTQTAMGRIAMLMRDGIGPALEAGRALETSLREEGFSQLNAENIATEYIVVCISHFRKG